MNYADPSREPRWPPKGMRDVTFSTNRCDHPDCLSRVTATYLVGLGGMPAFYCSDHAPEHNTETRPDGEA